MMFIKLIITTYTLVALSELASAGPLEDYIEIPNYLLSKSLMEVSKLGENNPKRCVAMAIKFMQLLPQVFPNKPEYSSLENVDFSTPNINRDAGLLLLDLADPIKGIAQSKSLSNIMKKRVSDEAVSCVRLLRINREKPEKSDEDLPPHLRHIGLYDFASVRMPAYLLTRAMNVAEATSSKGAEPCITFAVEVMHQLARDGKVPEYAAITVETPDIDKLSSGVFHDIDLMEQQRYWSEQFRERYTTFRDYCAQQLPTKYMRYDPTRVIET